jgi:hypothetical protein
MVGNPGVAGDDREHLEPWIRDGLGDSETITRACASVDCDPLGSICPRRPSGDSPYEQETVGTPQQVTSKLAEKSARVCARICLATRSMVFAEGGLLNLI